MTNHEELRRLATEANVTTSHVGATQEIWDAINVDLQQILDDVSCWEGRHAERMCECLETAIKRLNAAVGNEREGYETAIAAGYENDALRTRLAEVEKDAARLNWIQRHLFVHKWNGVIDSGSQTRWDIWGGYRHITATMIGNTFGEAIDNAAKEQA